MVAVFSASTALAYLDCGGGRAPPKTTVPGCPGYVGPTSGVVSFSTTFSTTSSAIVTPTTSSAIVSPTDSFTDPTSEEDLILSQFIESSGVDDGLCVCSGYFCEFARPGCVSIGKNGVRSTITANPGYQTKSFDASEYSAYTATAGPEMYYSADGDAISSKPTATGPLSGSGSSASGSISHSRTVTSTAGSGVTATVDSSSTITEAPTSMTTMTTATNTTMATNGTSGFPVTAPSSGASKVSGLGSLAIILGLGMGAMTWL